jgi:hypothetical protein
MFALAETGGSGPDGWIMDYDRGKINVDTEQQLIAKMMLFGRDRLEGAVFYHPWIE